MNVNQLMVHIARLRRRFIRTYQRDCSGKSLAAFIEQDRKASRAISRLYLLAPIENKGSITIITDSLGPTGRPVDPDAEKLPHLRLPDYFGKIDRRIIQVATVGITEQRSIETVIIFDIIRHPRSFPDITVIVDITQSMLPTAVMWNLVRRLVGKNLLIFQHDARHSLTYLNARSVLQGKICIMTKAQHGYAALGRHCYRDQKTPFARICRNTAVFASQIALPSPGFLRLGRKGPGAERGLGDRLRNERGGAPERRADSHQAPILD